MRFAPESAVAERAARAAGAVLLSHFSGAEPLAVSDKGGDPREPVTAADFAADAVIRDALAAAFPADAILTEETPEAAAGPGRSGRRWIVDPLDGTANFVAGLPFWAVSIALEVEGEIVLGVVLDPVRDELFSSSAPGRVRAPGLASAVAAVLLSPEDAARPETVALVRRLRATRELGATALELAWVAAGRLDLCLFRRRPDRIWDWAAGARLIEEAGGTLAAWTTSPITFATLAGEPDLVVEALSTDSVRS